MDASTQLLVLPEACAVCLDPCERPCLVEPCMHAFCFDCILKWASCAASSPTCPLCKSLISHIVYDIAGPFDFRRAELCLKGIGSGVVCVPAFAGLTPGCDSEEHRRRRRIYLQKLVYCGARAALPSGALTGASLWCTRARAFLLRELQALLQVVDVEVVLCVLCTELHELGSEGLLAVHTRKRAPASHTSTRSEEPAASIGSSDFLGEYLPQLISELESFFAANTSIAAFDAGARYSSSSL